MSNAWLLIAILLSSLLPGLVIFLLDESQHRLRTRLNLAGAGVKVILVALLIAGVAQNNVYELRLSWVPGMDLFLRADALSVLFISLSTLLWLLTTVYAIGYLEDSPHRSRFFGFFSLCVTATIGLALAGNLLSFLLFYELLTVFTFPLVVHRGTPEALRGGRIYLQYTVAGGALMLVGVAALQALVGPQDFSDGGFLATIDPRFHGLLTLLFFVLLAGVGVKAALVPLHAWLPAAMVAPAPVSALLHAVAVVKAGAFGIVRIVYDVYGVEFAQDLGVLLPLAVIAAVTILYGSFRALQADGLKKRLAYSTISQVSYIALGIGLFGPLASLGGIVHLVHQGLMKITLFFCAGSLAETHEIHRVSEMNGVGQRMPWTMTAFTIAALGMIGVPPVAGFVTKWYLGSGALVSGQGWALGLLAVSSLLNAAYFLPILYRAWFLAESPAASPPPLTASNGGASRIADDRIQEAPRALLIPSLITAALALFAGLLAASPLSPLALAELVVQREYEP